jgi:hypothetical protein
MVKYWKPTLLAILGLFLSTACLIGPSQGTKSPLSVTATVISSQSSKQTETVKETTTAFLINHFGIFIF